MLVAALALAGVAACTSPRAGGGPSGESSRDGASDGSPPLAARAVPRDDASTTPGAAKQAEDSSRVVIVELFSSEGCSSCPPADVALAELSSAARSDGVTVVGLEHHVDYWDRLGWKDPFSSSTSTARQTRYASARGGDSIFTPEAVVDGVVSLVGSRRSALEQVIGERAARRGIPMRIRVAAGGTAAHVEIDAAPPRAADLVVAVTDSGLSTAVQAGENAGETLRHGPVVRWLRSAGPAEAGAFDVPIDAPPAPGTRAVVAMVQARPQGEIFGAAVATP